MAVEICISLNFLVIHKIYFNTKFSHKLNKHVVAF